MAQAMWNDKLVEGHFREQQRYSLEEFVKSFDPEMDINRGKALIHRLKAYGVLKQVKNKEEKDLSELVEEDISVEAIENGDKEQYFVFTFVGVLWVGGCILKCYPKYFTAVEQEERRAQELTQVFKVLKKYNRKADKETVYLYNDRVETGSFNFLAVMLYLLQDYHENGLYTNEKEIVETNGAGEILWDRTIHDTFALIQNGRPYYMELKTRRRISDENDYFRRLHRFVLSVCTKELSKKKILWLFDLTPAEETSENIDDFGDVDYICYRIEQELNVQFNTRKKLLLKTMYAFIKNESSLQSEEHFSMFGTNAFHVVWEAVCKKVLSDRLEEKANNALSISDSDFENKKLKEIIEKPSWNQKEAQDTSTKKATFIPDVVSVEQIGQEKYFAIFDAKYYRVTFKNGEINGQPGIESVSKQFLYEMAYRRYLQKLTKPVTVLNCFVFPYEETSREVEQKGSVTMPMFTDAPSGGNNSPYGLGLQPIAILLVKPQYFYQKYLQDVSVIESILNAIKVNN